ncbi:MAG: hypothetical protein A2898_04605 [Candidatus Kerfeldbacteria bacterium RIFCSPLOWO2_01_FULL_48_11]|uniref:HTH arsR-type domain-containing protein n=1 Tax=Candidatus Kerfeldbacteria bacterium RIFCSPLOWO2_01_FULL_48_11 TaxID=1798543 RepID=A0A1G2B0Y1_9BACT|nr:MAG: Transcriptional regulator, ArsR family [Parcubacteria group bacterium GW2011_GWA2_48_9]KKW16643.1 MAG: Transcriptional regulator, ArsR family [Parcubacteria group bacterium GW2011_GWC2_49_9]OGY82842.1 MAG: hypothetical protein A2898_04605 [Candidatus Kerfeldbacteria bacterium RIFCSPLOWO2_01_FULL_48_11]HCJ52422.1 hypothetical protein [Candidatus Kerfeldbacteria bacterium]HCM68296.1 hypothetical protein [Candidatus Kerfeldbacteria bacterium]
MYNDAFKQDSGIFQALANPKRLEIIQLLRSHSLTVTDIQRMTGMAQSNVSQHLQVLRQERLVLPKREGREMTYCLAHHNVAKAFDAIHGILVDQKKSQPWSRISQKAAIPRVIDPVCGMKLSPETAVLSSWYKRSEYYFCASGCKTAFEKRAVRYI